MNFGKYVFAQIMGLVSSTSFQTIVNRHSGDYKVKEFTCWNQYLCMAFAQLTHRESISDTVLCLKANANKLYHAGIGEVVAVSTITRANESRSFRECNLNCVRPLNGPMFEVSSETAIGYAAFSGGKAIILTRR